MRNVLVGRHQAGANVRHHDDDVRCIDGELCLLRSCAGIFPVQLKEISPLEQYQLITVGFLDSV